MNSRDRVLATLDHREPDRVPFDLGSSRSTSIHVKPYQALREYLSMPDMEPAIVDFGQQLPRIDDDLMDRLRVDVRGVSPRSPSTWKRELRDLGDYIAYWDEFGVGRRMPKVGGLYFDPFDHPLAGDVSDADIDAFPWPDPLDPGRFEGMADAAQQATQEQRAVYMGSVCSGITEVYFRLRGFEDGYMDLVANPRIAARIMERVLEIKLEYWGYVLREFADEIDVAGESDDLGGQNGLLFSPSTYRDLVKPLHAELFRFIKARTRAKTYLHSCGSIRELIPDLIDAGLDIVNPVQVSAAGMDSAELKREFGADLVFWGGGVDTQHVLPDGTPAQVRQEVRRHIEDLWAGGGFVFAAVHNIQANVPPRNVIAMWEALQDYGSYGRRREAPFPGERQLAPEKEGLLVGTHGPSLEGVGVILKSDGRGV